MLGETEKANQVTVKGRGLTDALARSPVFLIIAALFLLNLLLRVFYLRYDFVNGDEAVRALTASRVLDGARLYAEIVTDKPPATTYFYALVFALFGRSMKAVHLAAAMWNFATAMIVSGIAWRFYNRRATLAAALVFIYFSTNYLTQDMMAANTETLMALPYTAAFYFFMTARLKRDGDERASPSKLRYCLSFILAGVFTGLAVLFKQVAVFNLAFFVLYELVEAATGRKPQRLDWIMPVFRRAVERLLLVAVGFSIVIALLLGWLARAGTLADFWQYAVKLGVTYIEAMPEQLGLRFMLTRVFAYVLFNAALWLLAIGAAWWAIKEFKRRRRASSSASAHEQFARGLPDYRLDLATALWALTSLSGVFTGGRFFGHYFIQALPALSLLAARGIIHTCERINDPARRRKAQAVSLVLALLFLFGFVRIHHRTAILAYETITGARTERSRQWGMDQREREAEEIAQDLRTVIEPGEPLYIWDYGLDVYWRTRARPASRYLTPYYITGRFPEITSELAPPDEGFWPQARANLIEDLKRTSPRFILDVSGTLTALPYREVTDFIKSNYEFDHNIGKDPARPFALYRLK